MFHKPDFFKVYVKRSLVLPLRVAFALLGFYFLLELYTQFQAGVVNVRYGGSASIEDRPIMFILTGLEKVVISLLLFYLAVYAISEKKED